MFMDIQKKRLKKIKLDDQLIIMVYLKKVEDFIFKNRKNFSYKIGIARIFNITGLSKEMDTLCLTCIN